jgi:hypothetical protein
VVPRRPPPDPPSDESWDRRSLEGVDPESGVDRHKLRKLADKADTLVSMAESRERWAVFRGVAKHFIIWAAVMVAALSAFKEQILSLIGKGPGT